MKIKRNSGINCYVAPLNRTTATDPTKVSAPTNEEIMVSFQSQQNACANNHSMEVFCGL